MCIRDRHGTELVVTHARGDKGGKGVLILVIAAFDYDTRNV